MYEAKQEDYQRLAEAINVVAVLKVIENRWRYEAEKASSENDGDSVQEAARHHLHASKVLSELLGEIDFMLMPIPEELH